MKTIKILGRPVLKEEGGIEALQSQFNKVEKSFRLESLRGETKVMDTGAKAGDIIALEFEDGGEWIGSADDIEEIFGIPQPAKRGAGADIFPSRLAVNSGERGLQDIGIKFLHLIRGKGTKSISQAAAKKLGQTADEKMMPKPGLFMVNGQGILTPVKTGLKPDKYLLFIHGTLSSFHGSFGDLFDKESENDLGQTIIRQYQNKVLALQHFTLSQSPFDNALEVLKLLPKGSSLDILSHSRGGLVADILACCDKRNVLKGYSAENITLARDQDESLAKTLEQINALATRKEIIVEKVIRIACPANGTLLLSNRLDHFLNGFLRAIGLLAGGRSNPVYPFIRGLITDVIRARLTPGILPGLWSMVPESTPQRLINRPEVMLSNHLLVIEGDAEKGKNFWQSIQVVLTNLYYREDNDFVVHTGSMRYGALRQSGLYFFLSKDEDTSHFNYFKNENTRLAIQDALNTPPGQPVRRFEYRAASERDRGVLVDLFVSLKAISADRISGNKPVVILLPGIMGTHLSVNGQIIWADLGEIGKGRIVTDLHAGNYDVGTTHIIGDFYQKLVGYLGKDYDVYTMGYDWRQTLAQAVGKLNTLLEDIRQRAPLQTISIVAHSMGGLVVRDMMRLHPDPWSAYIERPGSRVILLGTPWLGSHLIMEVFTGHQSRVRQLSFLDTRHRRDELIRVFNQYPGVYELLPINEEPFEKDSFWNSINAELESDKILLPPLLNEFNRYKNQVKAFSKNPDLKNIYYIAGKSDHTTCAYRIRKNFFGKRLQYLGTPEGDGSVTWMLGIPKTLPVERLYYAPDTGHGDLANDESLFPGIREILTNGATRQISQQRPVLPAIRSVMNKEGIQIIEPMPDTLVSNRADEAYSILLDRPRATSRPARSNTRILEVSVVHGDLRIASHPVMAGHFVRDGITNAEAAIDYYFDRKLSERHRLSGYPEQVGESLVLFDPVKYPKGTVILGLGESTALTPFHLRKTVEAGIISYAMHFRDNVSTAIDGHDTAVSCLCIGTGYGRLPMEEALHAIVTGVIRANQQTETLNGLKAIKKIEFIELYEHIAQNAYYQLSQLENNQTSGPAFKLKKGIEKKAGARRKFQFSNENSWWHHFTTRLMGKDETSKIPRLQFTSASGIARVEEENTFTSGKIIQALLDQMAVDQGLWNKEYSKTLFEILVPNPFKEIIRHQNNILWKMDLDTASFPWELFHDYETDSMPAFARAGMIRQLYTPDTEASPDIVRCQKALVIADPQYSADGPGQLPYARAEGIQVSKALKEGGFETESLINRSGLDILNNLYNKEYKILHIAGHGTISDNPHETGIVLENGMYITPDMLKNLSRLPEFVFINCCYSGTVEPGKEKQYQQRYRFAANVGTQLIRMGVNAVVVAGWPVNDAAAGLFAEKLYRSMLAGKTFGDAVRLSREACWTQFGDSNNTWGAYQCYGDQWYRLTDQNAGPSTEVDYFTEEQILVDLYNFKTKLEGKKIKDRLALQEHLDKIVQRALKAGLYQALVIEKEADILSELDLVSPALERYKSLRSINQADFSVKALEQYCNLRMKSALGDKRITASQIRQLITDFHALGMLGLTPERLCLMGSAYQNLAIIAHRNPSKTMPSVTVSLKEAEKQYKKAFVLSDPAKVQDLIYPLANWLILNAINDGPPTIEIKGKKMNISSFLNQTEIKLKKELGRNLNFWQDISLVNLGQCKLFYTSSLVELDGIKNEIINNYKNNWNLSGTLKHLQTELDQIDFLIFGVERMKKSKRWKERMKKNLAEIRDELKEM
ncbi:MAG TPA: CHAT domain-containing protein [Saprospiraceae bacterium]|nr:CHAT domain-containing protein [Saprospiraceae bacterium]HNT21078.1 CHAT domain-containing protein [Saprospiraceae bacterium]